MIDKVWLDVAFFCLVGILECGIILVFRPKIPAKEQSEISGYSHRQRRGGILSANIMGGKDVY
ncbi:MAG: hypothetical protein ABIH84_00810 [bacterium]